MIATLYQSLIATLALGIILCGAYPLFVYGVGSFFFHGKATGGLIQKEGKIVGAHLIGQAFQKPEYFHGRPSTAGPQGYDASNSGASNLGPTHQNFYNQLQANIDRFSKENPSIQVGQIPANAVTSSGSGLDPHISTENAFAQVNRIAQARGVSASELKAWLQPQIEGPSLGLFGESVVNVLEINLELDKRYPRL